MLRIPSVLRRVGPGLVTGAADDNPSGIATYPKPVRNWACKASGVYCLPGRWSLRFKPFVRA